MIAKAVAASGRHRPHLNESHQGVDLVSMFRPVTKWADMIATPTAVPEMDPQALQLAQDRRPRRPSISRCLRTSKIRRLRRPVWRPLKINRPRAE